MKVIAIERGYINHKRVAIGTVFEMTDKQYFSLDEDGKKMKDSKGKHVTCSWVKPFKAEKAKKVDEPAMAPEADKAETEEVI